MNRKLSDIAFERYEALYEAELYREKERPMWGSEHEQAARRKVYEAIIAECSAPEVCTTPEQLEAQLRGLMNPEGATTKEVAKGAFLHSMLQLHVCREGQGGTIEEAKDNAQRADEWVGERLQEHGLTWADLQADWREFYKDEIERHRRSPQQDRGSHYDDNEFYERSAAEERPK